MLADLFERSTFHNSIFWSLWIFCLWDSDDSHRILTHWACSSSKISANLCRGSITCLLWTNIPIARLANFHGENLSLKKSKIMQLDCTKHTDLTKHRVETSELILKDMCNILHYFLKKYWLLLSITWFFSLTLQNQRLLVDWRFL